uniref:Secreted protein n=1 Tax=Ascaris lumbricoides TaxID=6252 RepID=A0A0M3IA08_ASCLU
MLTNPFHIASAGVSSPLAFSASGSVMWWNFSMLVCQCMEERCRNEGKLVCWEATSLISAAINWKVAEKCTYFVWKRREERSGSGFGGHYWLLAGSARMTEGAWALSARR